MDSFLRELRFAARSLAKGPGVTAVALVALALGIGANTAIFSVIDGVLLEPLAYPQQERLVRLIDSNPEAGLPRFATSPADFQDWKEQKRVFSSMAVVTRSSFNLTSPGGDPVHLTGARISGEFFEVFGLTPLLGRTVTPEDDRPGAPGVVVLSEALWRGRFAADPDLVGGTLTLDGEPHTVVGVMGAGMAYPSRAELWTPLAMEITEDQRGSHWLMAVGRLAPGVTLAAAQSEMDVITARLAEEHPRTNEGWGVVLERLDELMVEEIKPALLVLWGTVGLVLLIACANVANVVLARLAGRDLEVAVRGALGASRGRLVRLLLTESVLLAVAGGILGLVLAFWGTRALVALNADALPYGRTVSIDSGVLLFTLALSLLTGLAFGLVPAVHASRAGFGGMLREGVRGVAGGGRAQRLRRVLVGLEVALAVVLLVAAGLLLRSFAKLSAVSPGFQVRGALTARISLPEVRYGEDQEMVEFFQELQPRLAALPGVEEAGLGFPLPLGRASYLLTFLAEGRPVPAPNEFPSTQVRFVTPGYLEAMGIPLLQGRTLEDADGPEAPEAAVINRTLADRIWPQEDPVGRRFTFGNPRAEDARWITVVGVAGAVHHRSLEAEPDMETYVSLYQFPQDTATAVLRTSGDPAVLAGALREAVQSVDPDLPLYRVRTLEEVVESSLVSQRFNTALLGLFAGLALVLAAVGVYGVASYAVTQRSREMGLRMALGAARGKVLRSMVRQGMAPVGAGLALGLVLALAASRVMESLLYGVAATDPVTLVAVPLVLAAVALVASYLPALRATRVDPAVALRSE